MQNFLDGPQVAGALLTQFQARFGCLSGAEHSGSVLHRRRTEVIWRDHQRIKHGVQIDAALHVEVQMITCQWTLDRCDGQSDNVFMQNFVQHRLQQATDTQNDLAQGIQCCGAKFLVAAVWINDFGVVWVECFRMCLSQIGGVVLSLVQLLTSFFREIFPGSSQYFQGDLILERCYVLQNVFDQLVGNGVNQAAGFRYFAPKWEGAIGRLANWAETIVWEDWI